jgi:uncharacterized protein
MNPEAVNRFVTALRPAFEAADAGAAAKAAEKANVDQIHSAYHAISQGDFEGFRSALAADVELVLEGAPEMPLAGRWRGRDTVMEASARNYALLEDQRPEIEALVAQGDMVAVIAREKGRIRATGREYEMPWLHLFTFQDGKIARIYSFCDSLSMVEASRP